MVFSMVGFSAIAIAPEFSIKILIVEDSRQVRALYADYLNSDETLNYRILEAETVQEGLSLCLAEHPDVILVDYLLPDGSGLNFLEAIGKKHPDAKLPAIMLTSEGDERIAVQAMKLGARDYLAKKDVTEFSLRQSIQNLLDHQKAEAILQFQGQILEEIHDAVISTDIEGIVKTWNHGAERLYGYTSAEIIGQNISRLYDYPLEFKTHVLDPQSNVNRQEVEVKTRTKSGLEIDVSLRLSAVRNDQSQVIRLIGCSNDISDRKKAEAKLQATNEQLLRSNEELARANQLKDNFLSCISHELRTPLSNIKMAATLLEIRLQHLGLWEDDSNSIQRDLRIIKEECERETELITDLLELTCLDTRAQELVPVELQYFIPQVVASFSEQTRLHQQQLDLSVPSNLPTVTTDLSSLQRILHELLQNACKYTPPEERIVLSVQVFPRSLEIRVSNSGVDIPVHEQERIFEKFYRIPSLDRWRHGGTGLGLALVKQLVQRMGGTISIESGNLLTSFILYLPWSSLSLTSPDSSTPTDP